MRTRIKICCISSIQEAQTAIEIGADAIGLVAKMPSGPGPISDELIYRIAQSVPPLIGTFRDADHSLTFMAFGLYFQFGQNWRHSVRCTTAHLIML